MQQREKKQHLSIDEAKKLVDKFRDWAHFIYGMKMESAKTYSSNVQTIFNDFENLKLELNHSGWKDYLSICLERNIQPSTLNNRCHALIRFGQFLEESDRAIKNPFKYFSTDLESLPKIVEDESLPALPSIQEIKQFLNILTSRDRLLVAILYSSNLNVNQLSELFVENYDHESGCFVIEGTYYPVSPEVVRLLPPKSPSLDPNSLTQTPVLLNFKGRKKDTSFIRAIQNRIKDLREKAGLTSPIEDQEPEISPKIIQKFPEALAIGGLNIDEIQNILGDLPIERIDKLVGYLVAIGFGVVSLANLLCPIANH